MITLKSIREKTGSSVAAPENMGRTEGAHGRYGLLENRTKCAGT